MSDPSHSKPIRLAHAALEAALADDHERAAAAVGRINKECGGEGLYVALMAWCDAYHEHATDGKAGGRPSAMRAIRVDTGELQATTDPALPARVAWSAALAEARIRSDKDRFDELVAELPDNGFERGEYIGQVLDSVALTINGLPRGFARMGQGVES